MYKESVYNIIQKNPNGTYLAYNSFSGALGEFDKPLSDLLADRGQTERLAEEGFVVPSEQNEIEKVVELRDRAIRYSADLHFTIAPTLQCQADCDYCFQRTLEQKHRMTEDVAVKVASYLKMRIIEGSPESLSITWFGGEPTLNLEAVRFISNIVVSTCEAQGVRYRSTMITNGIALTDDDVDWLVCDAGLREVQISLDGLRDDYRMLKGIDAFDKVVSNIIKIADKVEVVVRLNLVDGNRKSIENLLEYLLEDKDLDGKITVYIAHVENTVGCSLKKSKDLAGDAFRDEKLLIYEKYGRRFASLKIKNLLPLRRRNFCHFEQIGNYVIGPMGEMYKCERQLGAKDRVVGYVGDDGDRSSAEFEFYREIENKCITSLCPMLASCLSGCPHNRMYSLSPKTCSDIISEASASLTAFAALVK